MREHAGDTGPKQFVSASAGVADDAGDECCQPGKQPRQWVQVLVASAGCRGLPAGRAGPGALHPSDVAEEYSNPGEESKRGAANRRLGGHQRANYSYWHEHENAERDEAERGRTSE